MTFITPQQLLSRLRCVAPGKPGQNLISLDFGTRKIGVAFVAEALKGNSAQSLGVIRHDSNSSVGTCKLLPAIDCSVLKTGFFIFAGSASQFFIKTVGSIIKGHSVGGIVVGWPLDPFGNEGPECQATREFIHQLRANHIYTPAVLWDERNSTKLARERLRDLYGNGKTLPVELRKKVDEYAAVVILEGFLDTVVRPNLSSQLTPQSIAHTKTRV